jgi:hypothetical protein
MQIGSKKCRATLRVRRMLFVVVSMATLEMEVIVKRISIVPGVFTLLAATCALAQTGGHGTPAQGGAQTPQTGSPTQSMNHAADAGTASPSSGTLMQRREKGMSPQGASDANATGKMKQ